MSSTPPYSEMEKIRKLAWFLPRFESPDFYFGKWNEPSSPEQSLAPGGYELSPTASEFEQAAYEFGWILDAFDWPSWITSPQAIEFRDHPQAIAHASAEQLFQLLTAILRQDRFCEGVLGDAYESGMITAILRRAVALAQTQNNPKTGGHCAC